MSHEVVTDIDIIIETLIECGIHHKECEELGECAKIRKWIEINRRPTSTVSSLIGGMSDIYFLNMKYFLGIAITRRRNNGCVDVSDMMKKRLFYIYAFIASSRKCKYKID